MTKSKEFFFLTAFYNAAMGDARIGATHISLYMAFFQKWNLTQFEGAVFFTRAEIMEMAKISSTATYHKCLADLVEYGYLAYRPSYDRQVKSTVNLHQLIGPKRTAALRERNR